MPNPASPQDQQGGTFELAGASRPPAPRLPGVVTLREHPDSVLDILLAELTIHARNCIRSFGDFHLALSLREQVEPALRRMMIDPLYRDFPWSRTRVWLVEELVLPAGDPRRYSETLLGLVLEGSGMPREQVHPIEVEHPDAAQRYERLLREHLGWRERGHDRLDYVLLPLQPTGELGGVVSLAPAGGLVTTRAAQGSEPARVAMTAALVRAARCVAVLASGEDAARGVRAHPAREVLGGPPPDGSACDVRWYLDWAACAGEAQR